MIFIVLGVIGGLVVSAVVQKPVVKSVIIGGCLGAVLFGGIALTAPRPKVPCWTEAQKNEIWRAMPVFCQSRKK